MPLGISSLVLSEEVRRAVGQHDFIVAIDIIRLWLYSLGNKILRDTILRRLIFTHGIKSNVMTVWELLRTGATVLE